MTEAAPDAVLWLAPGEAVPDGWTGRVARTDIRAHTYGFEGEAPVIATEPVWVRRRELGREVVDAFYARLEGRAEAEVLAPYREGLADAVALRCAAHAFCDAAERDLGLRGTPLAVVRGRDLASLARDWFADREDTYRLDRDGPVPFEAARPAPAAPLGDRPAAALLALPDVVETPPDLRPEGCVAAITSLSHGTQSVTLAPVVEALREREPVLLINTAPRALPDMPDHATLEGLVTDAARLRRIEADVMGLWERPGPAVPPGLRRVLARVMQAELPKLVVLDRVLGDLSANGGARAHLIGTTDSTHTSDFLRQRAPVHGVCRTVVQNAFVSGSARYTRPQTDRLLSVDSWSSSVIADELGVDPDIMEVVGSVRYAHLPALRGTTPGGPDGKAGFLARHDLPEGAHLFAFASQPSAHSSGALALIDAMEAAFGDDDDVAFALRLHPKELPDVVAAIEARVADTTLHVALDDRPIEAFLLSADAVLTEFSNVGLEAGILGVPLVILKLPGSPAIPPLDAFGIGRTVSSYDGAVEALRELMAKGPAKAGYPDTSKGFATDNPGLYAGDTVAAILRSVERDRA